MTTRRRSVEHLGPMLPGLRSARLQRGFSQLELGLEAGVDPSTIHALEHGQHRARRTTIRKLAAALRVDPVELTGPSRHGSPADAEAPASGSGSTRSDRPSLSRRGATLYAAFRRATPT